jgi:hypothetical protein
MSPLTIDRIKKANGKVKIVESSGSYSVQVQEAGVWVTVLSNTSKVVCEQAVRGANNKLILG